MKGNTAEMFMSINKKQTNKIKGSIFKYQKIQHKILKLKNINSRKCPHYRIFTKIGMTKITRKVTFKMGNFS